MKALTPREQSIVPGLLAGKLNKEIAFGYRVWDNHD
jgi:FixJ family two-component response regulator